MAHNKKINKKNPPTGVSGLKLQSVTRLRGGTTVVELIPSGGQVGANLRTVGLIAHIALLVSGGNVLSVKCPLVGGIAIVQLAACRVSFPTCGIAIHSDFAVGEDGGLSTAGAVGTGTGVTDCGPATDGASFHSVGILHIDVGSGGGRDFGSLGLSDHTEQFRHCNGGQDAHDHDHDHQFNKGKTLLFHVCTPCCL